MDRPTAYEDTMTDMNETRWGRSEALAAWLDDNGRSIYWLAKRLGMTYTATYYVVTGANLPRPEFGWRISALTGIPFEALYYGAKTQTPSEVGSEGDCA